MVYMEKVLLSGSAPQGCYVALKSKTESITVGKGKDPQEALNDAASKGYPNPILVYVPEKNSVYIYLCR
jgi:hypothetical protein